MAGFSKVYTSQSDYLKDVAKSTGLYSETEYAKQVENAQGDNYLAYLASLKDNLSTKFNKAEYDKLPEELKFGYLVHTNDTDTSSDNYKQNEEFYKQTIQKIKNDEIYESLNWFEKTMNTVGGWFANTAVAAYGTLEGLLNIGGATVGAVGALIGQEEFAEDMKKWVAKDVTGATAATNAIANWRQAYTFENKLEWLKVANDVASAIGQMTPMIIGTALAPYTGGASAVGTATYYLAMAGNTSEQAIRTNPDIDYVRLVGYTAGTTLLEWGTEWISGKVFGEGLIGAKGLNPKAMTSGIVKSLTHNMSTEAMEEAVSEIFGSLLEYYLVTDKDPDSLPTIENILYASLIGGLTGGFMAGGRIALTPRMAVTEQGEVRRVKDLTKEERQTANKLGLRKSWALQGLLQESANALSEVDNLTKLQAKYGTLSLQQIQEQHADEYNKAIEKDVKIKEKQAESFLALSKLMSTIGVEKFTQSAQLLNDAVESARQMADNYINHTDVANKKASEVFAANFPDKSFTPSAMSSKANQTLAETLRQAFPHLKVVFGTFGAKDGAPVRAINGAETYLFIDENMVAQKGYKQVLQEAVRYQLADQLMSEMNILDKAEVDALVKLFTDSDLSYEALDEKQKLTIAQILCFDPVNSRRLFNHSMKTHKKIFKYITDQSEYVKKFGRQTEANKIRYHDLLVIRNMYLQNIAETLGNMEDIEVIQSEYGLSDEETQEKITDKTVTTNANDTIKLTEISQVKNAIHQREAFNDLYNSRQDTTTDFDFDRLYDETYYSDEFVAKVTQTEPDFERALNQYVLQQHQTVFIDKAIYTNTMESKLGMEDVNTLAKVLLTDEYLETNPSWIEKRTQVIDKLYLLQNMGVKTPDVDGDTIIVKDNQIQGTGKIKFILGDLDGTNILSDQRTRRVDKGTANLFKRLPTRTDVEYFTNSSLGGVSFEQQSDDTWDDHQTAVAEHYKKTTGLTLHYYRGAVTVDGEVYDNVRGFVSENDVYVRYDGTLTNTQINDTLEHEATHRRIAAQKERYNELQKILDNALDDDAKQRLKDKYQRLYGKIYKNDKALIDEEMIVNIITRNETPKIKKEFVESFNANINGFIKTSTKQMKENITKGVRFAKQPNITDKEIFKLASTEYRSGRKEKSTAKGYEGREYEVASVLEYEQQNGDTLRKIKTLDDLKTVLKAIEDGKIGSPESGFVMDLLQSTIIPFNFKGDRYAKAKALFDETQSVKVTRTAQEMASRSELFAETNPMKSLANELSEKFGTEIKPSDKLMIKWVPMYADRTNWLNRLQEEYDEVVDKRKHTTDPYMRQQYTLQLQDLRSMIQAVADNDTATILDLTMKQLQDTDENRAKNAEQVQALVKDFVADLISHTDISGKTPKYDPNKKYILKPEHAEKVADLWNKVNAFRYLAMLSSPATWGRNALTNTLIATNAIVEDVISGKIEKSRLLRADSQANYTGDYDADFSKFVKNRYSSRIAKDTKGDKYHTTEIEQVRQEWAAENDPVKKSKLLYTIKQLEQKALNDQPWTTRRVMRNLTNTLAGSINMISKNVYAELKVLYKGSTAEDILYNMKKTKSPLAKLFEQVYITNNGNDMIGTIELASQLANTSVLLDEIYNNALYRGNKLLFKTDNILSKKIGSLKKKHPAIAALVTMFIPFAKTSYNTTAYIMNHSPIGLAKGIIKSLQTRNMYVGDMRQAIKDYHKTEFVKQHKSATEDFKYNDKEFMIWAASNLSSDVVSALNGDYNATKSVFDQYVELGRVNQNIVGSSDIFARANTIESVTQGLTGTAWMALGLIIGALFDGFMIDEDDYLGPVLKIGSWRIKLDDLSPFSTMFSVGAIINSSEGFLDSFEKFASIIVDASMLNVVGSAIQYSDNLLDYLSNQTISTVQQFVPAILKSVTKVIDNSKKNKTGNFFQKLWKTTLSNLPFFSYLVADKIDPYTGEKEKIYQSGLLEAALHVALPVSIRPQRMSDLEREARRVDAATTGLTGRFEINDKQYVVKDKEKYAKYRADYIEQKFSLILSGKQQVTVEDENGKRVTTTYDKLTDVQKKNVINRLYTEATTMTKIQWWVDQGNQYVVTTLDQFREYSNTFDSNNIVFKNSWSKSKFVEK